MDIQRRCPNPDCVGDKVQGHIDWDEKFCDFASGEEGVEGESGQDLGQSAVRYYQCLLCNEAFDVNAIATVETITANESRKDEKNFQERKPPSFIMQVDGQCDSLSEDVAKPIIQENPLEVEMFHRLLDSTIITNCKNCGNTNAKQFEEIINEDRGMKRKCLECDQEQDIEVRRCPVCDNSDPDKFMFDQDEESGSLALVCIICHDQLSEDNEDNEVKTQDHPMKLSFKEDPFKEELEKVELQCECGNDDLEQFDVFMSDEGVPVNFECTLCGYNHVLTTANRDDDNDTREGQRKNNTEQGNSDAEARGTLKYMMDAGAYFIGFKNSEDAQGYLAKNGIRDATKQAAYGLGGKPLKAIVEETHRVYDAVCQALGQKEQGEIDDAKCTHQVVRRTAQGLGTVAGITAGLAVGSSVGWMLPGVTLGQVLGRGIGRIVGDQAGKVWGKKNVADEEEKNDNCDNA